MFLKEYACELTSETRTPKHRNSTTHGVRYTDLILLVRQYQIIYSARDCIFNDDSALKPYVKVEV
jgi:hypothetical protein